MKKLLFGSACMITLLAATYSCKHEPEPIPPKQICFEEEVMPLIRSNCASASGCHSDQNPAKGIRLDSYENILISGTVRPYNPGESELYEVLIENDVDDRMPYMLPPLSADKIALIYAWIEQGALNIPCSTPCDTANVTYSSQVTKVLNGNCMGSCHGGSSPSSGISLQGYNNVKLMVDNGKLIKAINHTDSLNVKPMPYPVGSPKLNTCQIRTLEIWVDNGAQNN
jgi:hypothetical protein